MRLQVTIPCAAPGCRQDTAEQAGRWHAPDRAVTAARTLGWIPTRDHTGRTAWHCPLHQAWDPRQLRWIAAPDTRA